ncbi:MAG: cytochrome c biogenesis protein CcsA [Sandaracinaceae bacterium]|jgi:heme exporter protein C|nr:cytochrome c biogenesis protein CcsA [Sandaracinaceae bacterium]MBK8589081.1 cytochrome c biogenesis protein CcsA [Sandaracinaceae bacterium]
MLPADVNATAPTQHVPLAQRLWLPLWLLTVLLIPASLYAIFVHAPVEARMGIAQKIFYFHVPAAYAMYVGFATAALGSVGYLLRRSLRFDALSVAGAEVGMLFATMVLTSGPLWARKAWGVYWTWDPRLTTVMLAAMVFSAYLALRSFGEAGDAEKRFASGLSLLALPLLPIIHFSVQRWRGVHPTVITGRGAGLHPDMQPALVLGFVLFTALVALLILTRARLERLREELRDLHVEAARLGLTEDDR